MILVDANLLIYARSTSFSQHEAARSWLDQELNRGRRVALPWESLLAFILSKDPVQSPYRRAA